MQAALRGWNTHPSLMRSTYPFVTSHKAVHSARPFLKVERRKQVKDGRLVSEKFTDRPERHEIDT